MLTGFSEQDKWSEGRRTAETTLERGRGVKDGSRKVPREAVSREMGPEEAAPAASVPARTNRVPALGSIPSSALTALPTWPADTCKKDLP